MNIAEIARKNGINPKSLWRRIKVQGMSLEDALSAPWRGNKSCSIDGCSKAHEARGFCQDHYNQWYAHGDANKRIRAKRGSGWTGGGYRFIGNKQVHIVIAEKCLGKELPPGAVVHHANKDSSDNRPVNLVICQSQAYHRLLHQRLSAYEASGHPSWRKCTHCKKYDDQKNLYVTNSFAFHRECRRLKQAELKAGKQV